MRNSSVSALRLEVTKSPPRSHAPWQGRRRDRSRTRTSRHTCCSFVARRPRDGLPPQALSVQDTCPLRETRPLLPPWRNSSFPSLASLASPAYTSSCHSGARHTGLPCVPFPSRVRRLPGKTDIILPFLGCPSYPWVAWVAQLRKFAPSCAALLDEGRRRL